MYLLLVFWNAGWIWGTLWLLWNVSSCNVGFLMSDGLYMFSNGVWEKSLWQEKKKRERCIFECAITHTGVSMHVCNPHTPPFYFSFLFLIKKTSLIRVLPVVHIVKASGANYEWPASLLYHPISTPELLITLLLFVSLQPHFRTIRDSTPLVSYHCWFQC